MAEIKVKAPRPRWALPFQVWKKGEQHPYANLGHKIFHYSNMTERNYMSAKDSVYLFKRWYDHGLQLDASKIRPVSFDINDGYHIFSTLLDPSMLSKPGKELIEGHIDSPLKGPDGLMYWSLLLYATFASGAIGTNEFLRNLVFSGIRTSPNTLPLYAEITPELREKLGYSPLIHWGRVLLQYASAEVRNFKEEEKASIRRAWLSRQNIPSLTETKTFTPPEVPVRKTKLININFVADYLNKKPIVTESSVEKTVTEPAPAVAAEKPAETEAAPDDKTNGWDIHREAQKYASSPEGSWLKEGTDMLYNGYKPLFEWILENKPKDDNCTMLQLGLALAQVNPYIKSRSDRWRTAASGFSFIQGNDALRQELNRIYSILLDKGEHPVSSSMLEKINREVCTKPTGEFISPAYLRITVQIYLSFAQHFGAPEYSKPLTKAQRAPSPEWAEKPFKAAPLPADISPVNYSPVLMELSRELQHNWREYRGFEGMARLAKRFKFSSMMETYMMANRLSMAERLGYEDIDMDVAQFSMLLEELELERENCKGIKGQIRLAKLLKVSPKQLRIATDTMGLSPELGYADLNCDTEKFERLVKVLNDNFEQYAATDGLEKLVKEHDLTYLSDAYWAAHAAGKVDLLRWRRIDLAIEEFERLKEILNKNWGKYMENKHQILLANDALIDDLGAMYEAASALGFAGLLHYQKVEMKADDFQALINIEPALKVNTEQYSGLAGMVNLAKELNLNSLSQLFSGTSALGLAKLLDHIKVDMTVRDFDRMKKEIEEAPGDHAGNRNAVLLAKKYRIPTLSQLYSAASAVLPEYKIHTELQWSRVDLPVETFEKILEAVTDKKGGYEGISGQIRLAKELGLSLIQVHDAVQAMELDKELDYHWVPSPIETLEKLQKELEAPGVEYAGDGNQVKLAKRVGIDHLWELYLDVRALGRRGDLGYHRLYISVEDYEKFESALKTGWKKYVGNQNQDKLAEEFGFISLRDMYYAAKGLCYAEKLGYTPVNLTPESFSRLKKVLASGWNKYAGDSNQIALADEIETTSLGGLYSGLTALGLVDKLGYHSIDLLVENIRMIFPDMIDWANSSNTPLSLITEKLRGKDLHEAKVAFLEMKEPKPMPFTPSASAVAAPKTHKSRRIRLTNVEAARSYINTKEGAWIKPSARIRFTGAAEFVRWILENRPRSETNTIKFLSIAIGYMNYETGGKLQSWKHTINSAAYLDANGAAKDELNRVFKKLTEKGVKPSFRLMKEALDPTKLMTGGGSAQLTDNAIKHVLETYITFGGFFREK